MTDHSADVSKMVADNPGVQGLAQLGRNAIERVSELERENAELLAANLDLQAHFDALKADYDAAAKHCAAYKDDAEKWERLYDELEYELVDECQRDGFGCRESMAECARRIVQERDALKLRAEQAEARLAEIDAASTVQTVFVSPFRQIELIARPTKDQP